MTVLIDVRSCFATHQTPELSTARQPTGPDIREKPPSASPCGNPRTPSPQQYIGLQTSELHFPMPLYLYLSLTLILTQFSHSQPHVATFQFIWSSTSTKTHNLHSQLLHPSTKNMPDLYNFLGPRQSSEIVYLPNLAKHLILWFIGELSYGEAT